MMRGLGATARAEEAGVIAAGAEELEDEDKAEEKLCDPFADAATTCCT